MKTLGIVLSLSTAMLSASVVEAFQIPMFGFHRKTATSTKLFSDYLSGLNSFNGQSPSYAPSAPAPAPAPPASYPSWGQPAAPAPAPQPQQQQQQQPSWTSPPAPAPLGSFSAPIPSFTPTTTPQPSSQMVLANGSSGSSTQAFQHATLDFFAIPNLVSKGPRNNADVGQPHDATLKLGEDGNIRSGSWWCAAGGWPSLNPRTTTEIFYVLKGQGCLTDLDGARHYFGPGDTVILPKGWAGRWDVLEDIHKVWFVHDHPNVEHPSHEPIRVTVGNYYTSSPEYLQDYGPRSDAIHGSPECAGKKLYTVGPTDVGVWTCTPGSFSVSNRPTTECFHVLEGVFFLTNSDGSARRCGPGDTVILPKGWSGYWDVIETVKKLWVAV